MPYLSIRLNRALTQDKAENLLKTASACLAKELGKPERYVMVELSENPLLIFAGSHEPAAYLELKSIGLPTGKTPELSKAISGLIEAETGISASRIYIEFSDAKGGLWGWNGGTF